MSLLAQKKCIPCRGGIPALTTAQITPLKRELDPSWHLDTDNHLVREWQFDNFKQALDHTNKIGLIAEAEDHHPDIFLAWGRVIVTLWTHKINGLTENDFILAAKLDLLKS